MTAAVYQLSIGSQMTAVRLVIVTQWVAHLRTAINRLVTVFVVVEQGVSSAIPVKMGILTLVLLTMTSVLLASAITTRKIVRQLRDTN